jgi:arsenite-transporting ATPase
MIPGLSHMILLGNILDELEKDPELTVVLDSPASGHALTMFESSSNFKKIFRAGMIVKDIDRMHKFLGAPGHLKTLVVALANELAMNEAQDLKKELAANTAGPNMNVEIIVNDSFLSYINENGIKEADLPDFLKNRIALEKNIIGKAIALPHVDESNQSAIIMKLTPYMKEFV